MWLFTTVRLEQLGLRSRHTDKHTESKYATTNHCISTAIIALVLSLQQLSRKNPSLFEVIMHSLNMADTVFPGQNNRYLFHD